MNFLINRGVVGIFGADGVKFLQNLTTNDVSKEDYCYTYMLTNNGRYLFDFFVFRKSEEEILIDINQNQISDFISRIMLYKLRSKIDVIDLSNEYKILYSKESRVLSSIYSKKDPRYKDLGFRSMINANINLNESTKNELYLQDKYKFAIPDGYDDLIFDKSIPVEYGAEELCSISYTKGCYIGQEVVSRTKYQGVVRKKIFKLSANEDLASIKQGSEITVDGIKIGVFCSSYKNNAIGLIREERYSELDNKIAQASEIELSLEIPSWRVI